MNKPDKILRVYRPFGEFFRWWMKITRPFHRMKPQEIDVAAKLLEFRYDILKQDTKETKDETEYCASAVPDVSEDARDRKMKEEEVYRVLMCKEWKEKIASELDITQAHLNVLLSNLRKRGFLRDGSVNPIYIPDVENEESYSLMILFKFKKD